MLMLQRLLALVAAVALTIAAAVAVGNAVQNADPDLESVAAAIFAEKFAKADTPIPVRRYAAYYDLDRQILTDAPAGVPVYIAGLGDCPNFDYLLGKAYARNSAVVHAGRCVFLMPWAEGGVVTHYVFTCAYGSGFRPEVAEVDVTYGGRVLKIRAVVVNC